MSVYDEGESFTDPKEVVANWLTAVSDLYYQYNQVQQYLNDTPQNQALPTDRKVWIGQCPASELNALLATMENELEKLLAETNQLEQQSPEQNFEKLMNHTRLLQELNLQATVLLQLAALPAC